MLNFCMYVFILKILSKNSYKRNSAIIKQRHSARDSDYGALLFNLLYIVYILCTLLYIAMHIICKRTKTDVKTYRENELKRSRMKQKS